jgi:eukaryotic-like serine/threonine-protein kinase
VPFERLGDYEVMAPIAEGGMASVWLGRRVGRPAEFAALKVIRPEHARNKEFVAMFLDEAGIASRLSHPNIVVIRGFGDAPGGAQQPFLAMELLRGHTLLELFRAVHARGKRLPPELVAWIGARVADALHYAHELADATGAPLHIVHRDVNPANVFLTSEGIPKLIDFGLAKARDRITSTAIGVVKGKLAYLSPEQALGRPADRRSDVFSLGVTLWELSLDRRLFLEDDDTQTVRKVLEAEVPDPRTLDANYPPELAQPLLKALARDPEQRWPSAAGLRDSLDAFAKSRQPDIGAAQLRAVLTEAFSGSHAAPWERVVDEAIADNQATRVWDPAPSPPARVSRPDRSRLLLLGAIGAIGAILGGTIVRACRGRDAKSDVEQRVARLEDLLGVHDDGGATSASAPVPVPVAPGAAVSADDPLRSCAEAKVASYRAWQEALAKAKTNAQPAEAACASIWSESRKQTCYGAAMAQIRATQAARDSTIEGGAAARDALRAVKDDPKNEAIARARAASVGALDACGEDAGR